MKLKVDVGIDSGGISKNSAIPRQEIALKTRNLLSAVSKTVHGNPEMSADRAIEAACLSPTLESFYKAIARVEKIHN